MKHFLSFGSCLFLFISFRCNITNHYFIQDKGWKIFIIGGCKGIKAQRLKGTKAQRNKNFCITGKGEFKKPRGVEFGAPAKLLYLLFLNLYLTK
jgi:hypothetical protein